MKLESYRDNLMLPVHSPYIIPLTDNYGVMLPLSAVRLEMIPVMQGELP